MSDLLKPVYVKDKREDEFVEIQPEYVYMTIPADYVCIYHKILIMLTDFGVDLLKDCEASCKTKNRKVVDCFNMFNAAVAARKLNQFKLAETLINYIKGQIDLNYNGKAISPEIIFPVDEEGKLNALVGCGNKPKFTVDVETGKLYEEYTNKPESVFVLGDNDKSTELNDSTGK